MKSSKKPSKAAAKAAPEHALPKLRPPSAFLLAMEGRAIFEWASYVASWPLHGLAPRGDGHPVLVLPGLVATDHSTWPLRKFLQRCGYEAYPWELGFNIGPGGDTVRRLTDRVRGIEREHGRKLSLIGWSLGGAMAHALALAMPERVRQVITLGSPLGANPHATNAWRIFELVSGYKADDPQLHALVGAAPKVPTTAILSKTDGVVNWRISTAPESHHSESISVAASHLGLGVNPLVLWLIAHRLAQVEGDWKHFEEQGSLRSAIFRDPHRREKNREKKRAANKRASVANGPTGAAVQI